MIIEEHKLTIIKFSKIIVGGAEISSRQLIFDVLDVFSSILSCNNIKNYF